MGLKSSLSVGWVDRSALDQTLEPALAEIQSVKVLLPKESLRTSV